MKSLFNHKYYKYVYIHILLFISGIIIGVFIGRAVGNIGNIEFLDKPFYSYFFHNLISCFVLIGFGIITYGFLTWIPLTYNGIVLGMAIHFLTYYHSVKDILLYFSHAVFEIPALFLAIYLGKIFAVEIKLKVAAILKKKVIDDTAFKKNIVLVLIMIVLLFVASIIEAIPKI